ncbi:unnamed protein product [Allacma fusca]|uniref:Uncharacterized protein n=1 Tax=Allacma fusca TaxID=39272 RepID=A0A8J2KQL0_9HEXA|nr:unnamed protein product [Allacma fusca]
MKASLFLMVSLAVWVFVEASTTEPSTNITQSAYIAEPSGGDLDDKNITSTPNLVDKHGNGTARLGMQGRRKGKGNRTGGCENIKA